MHLVLLDLCSRIGRLSDGRQFVGRGRKRRWTELVVFDFDVVPQLRWVLFVVIYAEQLGLSSELLRRDG